MSSIISIRSFVLHLYSRTRLTPPLPPVSPSSPVLRPPVSHRGVHRPLLHGLQAVHHPAQPGLAPQSCRYLPFFPVQLYFPIAMCIRDNPPPSSVRFASSHNISPPKGLLLSFLYHISRCGLSAAGGNLLAGLVAFLCLSRLASSQRVALAGGRGRAGGRKGRETNSGINLNAFFKNK